MAEEQKFKQLPISEQEASLLRDTFKNNEYLLKVIRSLFFGYDIADSDKLLVKSTFKDPQLREAVRKKIYPNLSNEVPIGQVADFWMGVETQIFGFDVNKIRQAIESKNIVLKMLKQSMSLLVDPDSIKVSLEYNPELVVNDELQIGLLARNLYIRTIETGLNFIQLVANQEVLSRADLKKKELKDSSV